MTNRITWLLDNGHGGMLGATYYQTAGKQSPEVIPGSGIYEGEFNRDIVLRVLGKALSQGIQAIPICATAENIPLKKRVQTAHALKAP